MKNYLRNVLSLSALLLTITYTACSESDNDDTTDPDIENVDDSNSETDEGTDNGDDDDGTDNEDDDNGTTQSLTECYICPFYSIEQRTASNPDPITISEPEATVCKGEDDKAYLDGVLNTNNLDYEDYLSNRQMIMRCFEVTN